MNETNAKRNVNATQMKRQRNTNAARVATQFLSQNSRTIQGHFKDFSAIFANFQGLFDTKFKDFKDTEKIPKLKIKDNSRTKYLFHKQLPIQDRVLIRVTAGAPFLALSTGIKKRSVVFTFCCVYLRTKNSFFNSFPVLQLIHSPDFDSTD